MYFRAIALPVCSVVALLMAWSAFCGSAGARPDFDRVKNLYMFDGKIPRKDLERILGRSVTHVGLCDSVGENTMTLDDDIRMLKNIGARFVGRTAFAWETPKNDDKHFNRVKTNAMKVHAELPHVVLQACIFEIVQPRVNNIPIPHWVFREFKQPVKKRNFNYKAMLYTDGNKVDHWRNGSVPDMSQLETRMWFYYRARRYIDSGMEAIHFGQVMLMDDADEDLAHWHDMLSRVRAYARKHARRQLVLCDAHTFGSKYGDNLLFDFHSFPLRATEVKGKPLEAKLHFGAGRIFGRSKGGLAPSGWHCKHLPYIVEFDNWGYSGKGGEDAGGIWVWGYDDMSWFAVMDEGYRSKFLDYAINWLKEKDPNGHLQIPTRRRVAAIKKEEGGVAFFAANNRSKACPDGQNVENTIKQVWAEQKE